MNSTEGYQVTIGIKEILEISLYSVIFLLGFVGNILVIITLSSNKMMKNMTNLFILNLVNILFYHH